jgi:signal transduction histidine kinase
MKLTSSGGEIRLSIQDDGCGLSDAPAGGRGLGLIGMRARARSAGGDVTVRSRPGQGVLIEVRVPLQNLQDETHSHPVG